MTVNLTRRIMNIKIAKNLVDKVPEPNTEWLHFYSNSAFDIITKHVVTSLKWHDQSRLAASFNGDVDGFVYANDLIFIVEPDRDTGKATVIVNGSSLTSRNGKRMYTGTIRMAAHITLRVCPYCGAPIAIETGESVLPQIDAGARLRGVYLEEIGTYACAECSTNGKIKVECARCAEMRPLDQIQETVCGDHFCKTCYATMTAKAWDEMIEEADCD